MVKTSQQAQDILITLSPNRSATWFQTKLVIAVMFAVVMIIAIAWSFVGAWIVLPFAGLEIGLFAFLMYKVSKFTYSQQVIHIAHDTIKITSGYRKNKQYKQISRKHVDVYYSESEYHWELPKIALCDNQQHIVIGEFLNLDDRKLLKLELEAAGLIVCRNRWWTN